MESEKDNNMQVESCVEYIDSSCREVLDLDIIFNKNIEESIEKLEKKTNTIDNVGNIVCYSMNTLYIACIFFMPLGKSHKILFHSPPVISFLFWHFCYFAIVQSSLWVSYLRPRENCTSHIHIWTTKEHVLTQNCTQKNYAD